MWRAKSERRTVCDRLGIWFWNISASETRHRFRLRFGIRGHRRRRRCVRFGARLTESVPKFGPATCRMILPIMLLVIVAAIVRCWPGASMRTFRRVPFVAGTALHQTACENGCVGLAVRTQRPTAAAGIHHLRACARRREDKWRSANHVWNTALVRHGQYQTHCLEHVHGRAWSSRKLCVDSLHKGVNPPTVTYAGDSVTQKVTPTLQEMPAGG